MENSDSQNNEQAAYQKLLENWPSMPDSEKIEIFKSLPYTDAEELFLNLSAADQSPLFEELSWSQKRAFFRLLAPDDAADLIQVLRSEEREKTLSLLDEPTRREVTALLAYQEDEAGGLMNPRFIRLRPDVTVDVAIRYLRAQAKGPVETVRYAYVLDSDQKLLGVVSFRQLLLNASEKLISEIMTTDVIKVPDQMDQEEVSRQFSQHGLDAIPVVDANGVMKGIVTVDDIVEVVQEEATEDIHKLGGTQALDEPYPQTSFSTMIKKRSAWLMVLFIGQMLTANAMQHFEDEIARAVVLALFIPLVISSGGNSGSQTATLIIRALALRELRLRDWWRVLMREIGIGFTLGAILGVLGFLRIVLWPSSEALYGEHFVMIGLTVCLSLVGIVVWGSIAGSMLPFLLRKLKLDPAVASAPFVATLVDVTGLIIYFTIAATVLKGTLL